ncbi:MAG: hypothetical protein IJW33_06785 [Lentisphaeria bacterium]|nr:hypothetical protein [Lentisphaeria bacterium]
MKMNWYKTLLAGFLSAILTSTLLSAESKWRTEPAAKSALQEIDTAFGKGFRLHASFKGSLRAVKKLDAGKYAGKKVVLDAQFKFICHKNSQAAMRLEYKTAAGKIEQIVLQRAGHSGTVTLPWVRYAKQVTLPEKISDLKLVAELSSAVNGEIIFTTFRLIPESEAKTEIVKVPENWKGTFASHHFSDGLHAYSRNGKLIFRFDVLDESRFSATDAEKETGFVPFLPDEVREVAPGRKIRRKEVLKSLSVRSAPGQNQELFIAIGALRPLKNVTVKVSELKSSDGKTLPPSIFDPRQAELMNIIWGRDYYRTIPKVQIPVTPTAIAPDCPKLYNLISELPEDAAPGIYKGTVTITADGKDLQLPLTFEVLPFKLAKGVPYMFCYYHEAAPESFKWMKKYGANSVYLGDARAKVTLKNGKIVLDMKDCDALMECYRKSGMSEVVIFNPFHDRLASIVLELLNIHKRFPKLPVYGTAHYTIPRGQYPAEAEKLYKDIIREVAAYTTKNNYPDYLLHLMDEPAFPVDRTPEEVNRWTYRGWYAKMEYGLAKAAVPGIRTFCTAYTLPVIDNLRPELDVGCIKSSRVSRDEAVNFRKTVKSWGQPFWGIDWPVWWDDYEKTRVACGFLPADRKMEGFIIWTFYRPDTFDPDFELGDFRYGYQRTMYCYKDKDGNYCPSVVFEGVRAGANDWRYVETLRNIISKLPERSRISETAALDNVLKSEKMPLNKKRNYVIDRIMKLLQK